MRCEDALDRLSDHLDGTLAGLEEAQVAGHFAACAACRSLRDDVSSLVLDLGNLQPGPVHGYDALTRRLVASVPPPHRLPRRDPARERMLSVTMKRVAGWAILFGCAWWQLAGGAVTSFAAQEVVPTARTIVEDVGEATGADVVAEGARRVDDGLARFGVAVHDVIFGSHDPGACEEPTTDTPEAHE